MTLHEAIEKLLRQTERPMTTQQIADDLNKNNWYQKKDRSKITAYQIHRRTNNYANLFNRNGTTVSLSGQTADKAIKVSTKPTSQTTTTSDKDEHYVLDLCDKVLGLTSSRQHKFDFLLGDPNSKGVAAKLPVDSFYEELNLVVEYRERQHTESVNFFDKPNRMTVSGVHRGEQRRIYDERRREILPKHKINLVEISFTDFNHDRQKRIIKNPKLDEATIKQKLNDFLR
ncbi:MAG: HTH domain-containing protein [Petrimonas sp.]|nr:HTH domain-containing protein [Petrimonas sp.]